MTGTFLSALMCASLLAATAAHGAKPSDAQARYRADRAACESGQANQERSACLREASAALQAARSGQFSDTDERQLEQNRTIRCNTLPQGDREDCVRRMNGEGTTSGSVGGGGIYRELVRPVAPQ